ncbi:MAG: bifunctional riboflavin kinase/FAD synthetase [Firmicutes bacterium]|nr:bifunctional riboflavin kinase/FAD synthetase [Bacillota bacterium]
MQLFTWKEESPLGNRPAVLTIGFFDGFHLGHRALIREAKTLADELGAASLLMGFAPHPSFLFTPDHPVPMIYGTAEKEWILDEIGLMDACVLLRFDAELAGMPAEDFLTEVLIRRYHAAGIVVGDDFRFGRGNAGDSNLLVRLCREYGITCRVVPEVRDGGVRVSSSRIRDLLEAGNLQEANRLLGRPYLICGTVSHGHGLGHKALLPTINLEIGYDRVIPRKGVYVTRTLVGEQAYKSVTNIGSHPTVGEEAWPLCETFLIDGEGLFYQRNAAVEFYAFLRDERCFTSAEELHSQQQTDIANARAYSAAEKRFS